MIEVHDFMDSWVDHIIDHFDDEYPEECKHWAVLYFKWKEPAMYGLFGLGTMIIALSTYALFTEAFGWEVVIANSLSWVFCTLFAFFTNRKWVFPRHREGFFAFWYQLGTFSFGRAITLGIEDFMLWFFVKMLHFPNMTVKLLAQIVVVTSNYLISKVLVFRRNEHRDQAIDS